MRTGSSLRRITGMANVLAVTTAVMAASPAMAKDYENATPARVSRIEIPMDVTQLSYYVEDASGKPIRDAKVRTEITGDKRYVVIESAGIQAVSCTGWNNPIPTYSWSNHTVHYGMMAQCTGEVVDVRARGSLWSGPGYDLTNTLQDSLPGGGNWATGINTVNINRVRNCVDWGSFAWWELRQYYEVLRPWGWTPFVPYPLVNKSNIECVDIQ